MQSKSRIRKSIIRRLKKMKRVNVLIDFGKAFVDPNGSFYCGTTEEQKDKAAEVNQEADLWIYVSDVHSRDASEFTANGGLYPAHNLVKKDQRDLKQLGVEEGQTTSPELTDKLNEIVRAKRAGLIVPRHVFFQNYDGGDKIVPAFAFEDVEETFGVKKLDPQEYLDGGIDYIVNAKHMFNGAFLQSTEWMGKVAGVPDIEMNAFTLLKQQHGLGKGLQLNFTGVVMGICLYQSATGARQIFPRAEVNVIADACTHLVYEPLGIATEDQGNAVAKAMCQQVGVNYISTEEFLGK
jgi:nicotinamidase-related amidase